MINIGIQRFLQAKKVNIGTAISSFLTYMDVKIKSKHHNDVNSYIENNWLKFASFIDREIKNGNLKGTPVKLNTYFDEQREYKEKVGIEYKEANLSKDEEMLLTKIKKEYSVGFIQSFLMKKDIRPESSDTSYFSKRLKWLPLVRQAIDNGILLTQQTEK